MRPPFPVVLCPTDASELGNLAIPVAFRLAAAGGTVHLLRVLEDLGVRPSPADAPDEARRHRKEEEAARKELAALAPTVPEWAAKDVRAHFHVLRGSDVVAIVEEQARAYGAAVIVMSTHGRTGLGRLLLGSVAAAVVERTDLPVILVRRGQRDA